MKYSLNKKMISKKEAYAIMGLEMPMITMIDLNHPGVTFISHDEENAEAFMKFMREEGSAMKITNNIQDEVVCDVDKEYNEMVTNPFYFWYYGI